MPVEPTMPPLTQVCDVSTNRMTQGCPVCGAGLVPLRGQWRCTRCFFSLCVGCEPVLGRDSADAED